MKRKLGMLVFSMAMSLASCGGDAGLEPYSKETVRQANILFSLNDEVKTAGLSVSLLFQAMSEDKMFDRSYVSAQVNSWFAA